MYFNGDGVKKDIVKAYAWFSICSIFGDPQGGKFKDFVAKRMNKAQIAKARVLATELLQEIEVNKKARAKKK
jgi:TPR repeat protein